MTTTKIIAQNTAVQVVGKAASTLLGLFAVGIMTRTLGAEKFGWYATATGFLQFIGILSDFGFTAITAKMLAENTFHSRHLLNNLFTWRFITAILFQGIAPLSILLFPYPAPIKAAALIMSASFFAISLNQIFIGYYQSSLKMGTQITGELLGRLILVAGLFMVSIKQYGFLSAMLIITIASIAYTGYLWYKSPGVKFEIDRTISKVIFQKIWPTAITVICNVFYLQGDRVILPLYVSQTDMAMYSAAYRVLDIVIQGAWMIMGILMPLVTFAWSKKILDEFRKKYQMSLDLVSLVLIPIMFGVFALAQPIMNLIGGAEFVNGSTVMRLLSVAILGIAFGNIFGYLALAINHQKQAIWIYFSDAILTTILYFVLIPRYGIYGAAIAAIFSEFYAGIGLMLLSNYYARFSPHFKTVFKIILASGIMSWCVQAIFGYISPIISIPHFDLLVSIMAGIIIYALLVLLFRVISKKTIQEVFFKPTV